MRDQRARADGNGQYSDCEAGQYNTAATSCAWLFKLNLNRNAILSHISHLSSAPWSQVAGATALDCTGTERPHHHGMRYWTAPNTEHPVCRLKESVGSSGNFRTLSVFAGEVQVL